MTGNRLSRRASPFTHPVIQLIFSAGFILSRKSEFSFFTSLESSVSTRSCPRTTSALSFFDPITAPSPERAARRPRSLTMPEMSESFSPLWPIVATL